MTKKNTNEIFVDREVEVSLPPEDKPKKKVKKEMSAERRQKLLEQLKKGRETAKKNRLAKKNKNSEDSVDSEDKGAKGAKVEVSNENVKIIEKPKTEKQKEETIKNTWSIHDDINELKYQLRELRGMMNKTKKEEKVEAKIEKIIEKKETIEEKQNSSHSTHSTHNPKPPPSKPIPIPQPPQRVVKSLFKKAMW